MWLWDIIQFVNNKRISFSGFQFAIGDKNGVLQCISIKDEEPVVNFKTLPGKPITSLQLASSIGLRFIIIII